MQFEDIVLIDGQCTWILSYIRSIQYVLSRGKMQGSHDDEQKNNSQKQKPQLPVIVLTRFVSETSTSPTIPYNGFKLESAQLWPGASQKPR